MRGGAVVGASKFHRQSSFFRSDVISPQARPGVLICSSKCEHILSARRGTGFEPSFADTKCLRSWVRWCKLSRGVGCGWSELTVGAGTSRSLAAARCWRGGRRFGWSECAGPPAPLKCHNTAAPSNSTSATQAYRAAPMPALGERALTACQKSGCTSSGRHRRWKRGLSLCL